MLYQGSGESGIGVQTAIQQCQPADGRLGAYVGPLVSHRERMREATQRQGFLKGRNTLEFGFFSVKKTDFNCLKCSSTGTRDGCFSFQKEKKTQRKKTLPASCCEHLPFPRLPLPLYPLSSLSLFLTMLTFFFLKHHRSKSADKRLYKFSQAFKNYHHFIMDNHS